MRIIDRMRWLMKRDINYGQDYNSDSIRVYGGPYYPTVIDVDVKIWEEQIEIVGLKFDTTERIHTDQHTPVYIAPRTSFPLDSGFVFSGVFDSIYTETLVIFIAYGNMSGGMSLYPISDSEFEDENMRETLEILTKDRYRSVFELDATLQRIINL